MTAYQTARHEAAHVMLAEGLGAITKGVWLGEDGGGVASFEQDDVPEEGRIEIALAGIVGDVLDEAKAKGVATVTNWRTLATWLTESSSQDAALVRVAMQAAGLRMPKSEAVTYLAETAKTVASELLSKRKEWDAETRAILDGERTPMNRGGYFLGSDGRPVYFGAYPTPMPTRDYGLDADPFEPEPEKRKNPARIVRDKFGRLLGIEGDD
jgi:hypothetical protein